MAAPSIRAIGAHAAAANNVTFVLPTHAAGDLLVLPVESAVYSSTAPTGWAHAIGSPIANAGQESQLNVFIRRATSAAMPNPTVSRAGGGEHLSGRAFSIKDVPADGSPWEVVAVGTHGGGAVMLNGGAVSEDESFVVVLVGNGTDANSTAAFSNWGNAGLTGFAEIFDQVSNAGGGGGVGAAAGVKASAGTLGTTSVTAEAMGGLNGGAYMVIAFQPVAVAGGASIEGSVPVAATPAATMAFSSPGFVYDSFSGTPGSELSTRAGEIGATWTKHPSYSGDAVLSDAHRLRPGAVEEAFAIYYASGIPSGAEYDVGANLTVKSVPAVGETGIGGRISTSADTGYYAAYSETGGWRLYRAVAGTYTVLGSFADSIPDETTRHVRLQIRDATKKVFIDGVERISSADNTITAAGRVGLHFFDAATDSTGTHLDNVEAIAVEKFALSGAVGVSATPSATMAFAVHETIDGAVTVELVPSAAFAFATHRALAGSLTTTAVPHAGLVFGQQYELAGSIESALTPAALLQFARHEALAGSITTAITPAAETAFTRAILGQVTVTTTPSAALQFAEHHVLEGSVTSTLTPAASFAFARAIVGAVSTSLTPAAELSFAEHFAIAGSITSTATPAATTVFSRPLVGAIETTVTPAASLVYAEHRAFAGQVTTQATPAAAFVFGDQFTLAGAVATAALPAATFAYAIHPALAGGVSTALLPSAAFQFARVFDGAVEVQATPAAAFLFAQHHTIEGAASVQAAPAAVFAFIPAPGVLDGAVETAITPSATLAFAIHEEFQGATTTMATPVAETLFADHYQLAGSTSTTVAISATLALTIHPAIEGQVTLGTAVAAEMHSAVHAVLDGQLTLSTQIDATTLFRAIAITPPFGVSLSATERAPGLSYRVRQGALSTSERKPTLTATEG